MEDRMLYDIETAGLSPTVAADTIEAALVASMMDNISIPEASVTPITPERFATAIERLREAMETTPSQVEEPQQAEQVSETIPTTDELISMLSQMVTGHEVVDLVATQDGGWNIEWEDGVIQPMRYSHTRGIEFEDPIREEIITEDGTPLQRVEDAQTIAADPEPEIPEEGLSNNFSEVNPLIPGYIQPNSNTLSIDETTSRFSSAVWFEAIQRQHVTLAGVGGIGSYIGFLLSRIKPSHVYLYDDDVVEAANMSGQLYMLEDVGKPKVEALRNLMRSFSNYYATTTFNQKFVTGCPCTDIMICGFDNMEARRTYYESWKAHVTSLPEELRANCLFIDGRLAAEELQIFCITGVDTFYMQEYESKWLFTDNEAEATLCSFKQTSHVANMIASLIVNLFTNFVAIRCDDLRDLPFFTEYTADMMFFNTIK